MIFQKIKKGDKIGIISFSDACKEKDIEILNYSKNYFNEKGISIVLGDSVFDKKNDIELLMNNKVSDFNKMLLNEDIKLIAPSKGGNSCFELLDKLDFEMIKKYPKIYIGFSDNTIILNAIYAKTNIQTYHFINYKDFGKENNEFNRKQFEKAFLENNYTQIQDLTEIDIINHGKATGTLIGGNLTTFIKIMNTEYCPKIDNAILFLEDLILETTEKQLKDNFIILKNKGVFDKISGIIFGNYSSDISSIEDIAIEVIGNTNLPIIKTNDIGHTYNNIVVPIGLNCSIDTYKNIVRYNCNILGD